MKTTLTKTMTPLPFFDRHNWKRFGRICKSFSLKLELEVVAVVGDDAASHASNYQPAREFLTAVAHPTLILLERWLLKLALTNYSVSTECLRHTRNRNRTTIGIRLLLLLNRSTTQRPTSNPLCLEKVGKYK